MSLKEEVKEALKDLKFFCVFYNIKEHDVGLKGWHRTGSIGESFICTYRTADSLDVLYQAMQQAKKIGKYEIEELTINEVHDMLKDGQLISMFYSKLYCVELKNEYDSLEHLAEDLMIYRISGMIDKEMEGMVTDEQTDVDSNSIME